MACTWVVALPYQTIAHPENSTWGVAIKMVPVDSGTLLLMLAFSLDLGLASYFLDQTVIFSIGY